MTTFISLDVSATMFSASGTIKCSELTPELIKARMSKVDVVSALNPSHSSIIEAIRRRYGLELPTLKPGEVAPNIELSPGDELFVVQSHPPCLAEGAKRHSDEVVVNAPISFRRWRVPMTSRFKIRDYYLGVAQSTFDEIIDDARAIALWQRGEEHLKTYQEIEKDLKDELAEFYQAVDAWDDEVDDTSEYADVLLEGADVAYKALCLAYQHCAWHDAHFDKISVYYQVKVRDAFREIKDYIAPTTITDVIDVMLAKYARRANGEILDLAVERELALQVAAWHRDIPALHEGNHD